MDKKKPIFTYHFPSSSKVPSPSTASSGDNFWNWWIPEEFRHVKIKPSLKKPTSTYVHSSASSSTYTTASSSMTTPSPPSSVCSSGYSYSPGSRTRSPGLASTTGRGKNGHRPSRTGQVTERASTRGKAKERGFYS